MPTLEIDIDSLLTDAQDVAAAEAPPHRNAKVDPVIVTLTEKGHTGEAIHAFFAQRGLRIGLPYVKSIRARRRREMRAEAQAARQASPANA